MTLPIGILAPLLTLNFNFNMPRTDRPLSNAFYCMAEILAYALTGWITGAAFALCFNVIAKATGGIDAKYVSTIPKNEPAEIEARP